MRHGETEANLDHGVYVMKPDHDTELTPKGRAQAEDAGAQIRASLRGERLFVYCSPFRRCRDTLTAMRLDDVTAGLHEEPRLREQDFGNFQDVEAMVIAEKDHDRFGRFYYRFANGESGADVFDRVSGFMDTLHHDFEKADYPRNVLIVAHGLTMRLFCMRWFHWEVEYFEGMRNPTNGETRELVLNPAGNYELDRPFELRSAPGRRPSSIAT